MVALRLDHRLRGRIDPSDVIQEAFLEATECRSEYDCQSDPMPPFLWLRFLTLQRLQLVHRRQLGTRSATPRRDISIDARGGRGNLCGAGGPASRRTIAPERSRHAGRKQSGDCSRHLTGCTRSTARCWFCGTSSAHQWRMRGQVLGLSSSAATKHYLRALSRLKDILSALPGGEREVRA